MKRFQGGGVGRATYKEMTKGARPECSRRELKLMRQLDVIRAWVATLYRIAPKEEPVRSTLMAILQATRHGNPLFKEFYDE